MTPRIEIFSEERPGGSRLKYVMRWVCGAVFGWITLCNLSSASAGDRECDLVQTNLLQVDGMIQDWQGIAATRMRHAGTTLTLACAYDGKTLFIKAYTDDKRVNGKRDRLTFVLRSGNAYQPLTVRMAPSGARRAGSRSLNGKAIPRWMSVEDSLQKRGWAAELAIPLGRIDGWGATSPALRFRIKYDDIDASRTARVRGQGWLRFAEHESALRGFLQTTGLVRSRLQINQIIDLDGQPGTERAVQGGAYLGVVHRSYVYRRLPVQNATDVKASKIADLHGDGRGQFLVAYRESLPTGAIREVLAVYGFSGGAFQRLLAVELARENGGNSVRNTWRLVPRGRDRTRGAYRKRRGYDLLIESGASKGWNQATYNEPRSLDIVPLLLPWTSRKSTVYYFNNNRAVDFGPKSR